MMSRRPREAWGPARRAAFAVVPAAFGALMLLAGSRGSTDGATQRVRAAGTVSPLHLDGDMGTIAPAALAAPASGAPAGGGAGDASATTVPVDSGGGPGTPSTTPPGAPGVPATAAGGDVSAGSAGSAPAGAGSDPATTAPRAMTSAPADPGPSSTVTTAAVTPTSSTSTTSTSTTSTTTTTVAPSSGRLPSVEAALLPLTNRDRAANGLGALTRNSCIDAVASSYAQTMARNQALVHNPADASGVTGCVPNASWGDNIGTASQCDAGVLEDAWMASPTHRHNILTPGFTQVGFGAWTDTDGACWVQVLFSS